MPKDKTTTGQRTVRNQDTYHLSQREIDDRHAAALEKAKPRDREKDPTPPSK